MILRISKKSKRCSTTQLRSSPSRIRKPLPLLVLIALAGMLLLHCQVVVVNAAHCVCPQSTPPPTITDQFENAASVFRGTLLEIHPNDDDDEFPYVVLYASELFKGHRTFTSTSTTVIPTAVLTNSSSTATTIKDSSSNQNNNNGNDQVTNHVDEKQETNNGSNNSTTTTTTSSTDTSTSSWFKRYEATLRAESTNVDRKVYTKRGSCGIVQWFDPKFVGKEFLVYTTFVDNEDDQDGLIDSLNDVPTGSVLDGITSTSTNMEDLKSSQQIVENRHNDNHNDNDREEDSQRYNSRDREIVEEGTPITNNVFGVDIQMIDTEFSSTTSTATITIPKKKIRREWSIVCDGTKEILPDEEQQQQQQPSVTEASGSNGGSSETIDTSTSSGGDSGSIEDFVEAGNLDDDATTTFTESMTSSNHENNPTNSDNNNDGTNNDDSNNNSSNLVSSSTNTAKVLPPSTTNVDDELNELMWVALEETFPDCLQKKAEECRNIIQTKRPDLAVELILVSKSEQQTSAASLLDQTLDLGRVRVYVNHDIMIPSDMLNNNAANAASTTTTTSNQLPAVKIPGSDVPLIETPAAPVQQQEGESQTQDAAVQSSSSSDQSSSNSATTTTSSETSTTQSDHDGDTTTSMATTTATTTIPKRPPSLWRHIWDVIRYGRQEDIPLLGVIEYKDATNSKNTTTATTTAPISNNSSSTVVPNKQKSDSITNKDNQEPQNTDDQDSSSGNSETNKDINNVDDTTPASNTNANVVETPSESQSTADPTKRLEDAYVIHIPFVG